MADQNGGTLVSGVLPGNFTAYISQRQTAGGRGRGGGSGGGVEWGGALRGSGE